MKLLIDLGNSRLKWALWNGTQLQRGSTLTHARSGDGELAEGASSAVDFSLLWKELPPVNAALKAKGLDQIELPDHAPTAWQFNGNPDEEAAEEAEEARFER